MTVSDDLVRRVWAAVTKSPSSSTHELADQLGISFSSVSVAIRVLHDAEYIDAPKRWGRAKGILLGYYEIEKDSEEGVSHE